MLVSPLRFQSWDWCLNQALPIDQIFDYSGSALQNCISKCFTYDLTLRIYLRFYLKCWYKLEKIQNKVILVFTMHIYEINLHFCCIIIVHETIKWVFAGPKLIYFPCLEWVDVLTSLWSCIWSKIPSQCSSVIWWTLFIRWLMKTVSSICLSSNYHLINLFWSSRFTQLDTSTGLDMKGNKIPCGKLTMVLCKCSSEYIKTLSFILELFYRLKVIQLCKIAVFDASKTTLGVCTETVTV